MSLAPNLDVYAAAVAPNAGAPGALSVNSGHFVNSFTRAGAGDITLSLQADAGVDATNRVVILTPIGAAAHIAQLGPASTDTALQVLTFDAAGVAADIPVAVLVVKRRAI